MILYHGSTEPVVKPVILEIQRLLDFGKGFYVTSNREQANKWALIKQNRTGNDVKAIVSVYEFDEKWLSDDKYHVKTFDSANEAWFDFIVSNRRETTNHPYDIVKGAVANDTLYATLVLFESGILSKQETIVRLKAHKLFDQISFHNALVLNELKFKECYQLT